MAARKGYNRFFIIFQEEDKGYGIAIDRQPTGYAKIESKNGKCKITVYAQNMKKDRGPYHFCMMDTSRVPGLLFKVGEVKIDEAGKGETWWEYNEENIADSNCPIDKFNVAAIIAQDENILAPLVGYVGKDKIQWKDKITIDKKEGNEIQGTEEQMKKNEHEREGEHEHKHEHGGNKKEENIENCKDVREPEILDEEALKFKKYEELLRSEENSEIEAGEGPQEVPGKIIVPMEDTRGVETLGENSEAQLEGTNGEISQKVLEYDEVAHRGLDEVRARNNIEVTRHGHEKDKHMEYKHHASMFHRILEQFEEVEDFLEDNELGKHRWWRVPYNRSIKMLDDRYYPMVCTIFYLNMTYPHIDYIKYFLDTGYYYFGIKYDENNEVKHIMYGIQGDNHIKAQPYMGMTGFGKWIKMKNRDDGIWVLFYNPRTGNFMMEKKD